VDRTAEDLKARTKRFAIAVFDFIETLPHTTAAAELARQLSRSGMGVAGNYRSACRARSHTEFTARLGIVLEEADEAELWLDVSDEKRWGDNERRAWLLDESGQLRAIFSRACMTARIREHRHR
jgi:four helix bundle protein